MKTLLLFCIFHTIIWCISAQNENLNLPYHRRQFKRYQRNICNTGCSGSSCQTSCSQPQYAQHSYSSSCRNQCHICPTSSCQYNAQCNQCCQNYCQQQHYIPQQPVYIPQQPVYIPQQQPVYIPVPQPYPVHPVIPVTTRPVPITIRPVPTTTRPVEPTPKPDRNATSTSIVSTKVNSTAQVTNVIANKNSVYVPINISNNNIYPPSVNRTTDPRDPVIIPPTRPTQPPRPAPTVPTKKETEYIFIIHDESYPVPHRYPVHIPQPFPVRVPIQVPVPVPVHQNIPVPVPVPIPIPIHSHPCFTGPCHQTRQFFHRNTCYGGQCGVFRQDCGGCQNNFYHHSRTYEQCYGCYM